MVELGTRIEQRSHTPDDLILLLEAEGRSRGEIKEILTTAIAALEDTPKNGAAAPMASHVDPEDHNGAVVRVYETVPPHLITVAEAAREHSVTTQAVYQGMSRGAYAEAGILRSGSTAKNNVTLLDRDAVAAYFNRHATRDVPVLDELPETLIDLSTARKKYGLGRQRFYNWINRGHLEVLGRLRAPARGGGYLVVSKAALERLVANPPRKGRSPSS